LQSTSQAPLLLVHEACLPDFSAAARPADAERAADGMEGPRRYKMPDGVLRLAHGGWVGGLQL
jgi:hypothetical protein